MLKQILKSKPETLQLSREIISLDAGQRCDPSNILNLKQKFLDYLRLAYEVDVDTNKWSTIKVDKETDFDPEKGEILQKYKEILEKEKSTKENKPLRFKKKIKVRTTL